MEKLTEKEEKSIECPICNANFTDLRGLTSHARHAHQMTREEIYDTLLDEEEEKDDVWKILIGGVLAISLTLIGLKR